MVALGLLLAACPESTNTSSVTLYDYVCANGTPADGGATEENSTRCTRCRSGYKLTQAQTCVMRPYVCEHGTPSGEDATADDITKCQRCSNGYVLTAAETCNYAYVCSNGIPSQDTDAAAANITKCQRCISGYVLTTAETCNHAYVCENGTPSTDTDAAAANINKCQRCSGGFKKTGDDCVSTQYTCSNGTLDRTVIGKPSGTQDEERCESCSEGYLLTATNSCTNDLDSDGVLNTTDVDDDNDGLIEVPNLTMLHNMRHNLRGTSYKDAGNAAENTTGAPTASNKATDYACSGTGLCGYELTQDLTFDKNNDGATFTIDGGSVTLNSNDSASPYFVTSQGGWVPIGDTNNPFRAIFEGNGHIIRHLAIRRNQTHIGMFGAIDTGANIRNLGLVDGLADYSGSSNANVPIGGLVGRQNNGTIIASYADVTADAGTGWIDEVGGLVGTLRGGYIIASYSTGNVNGRGFGDYVGGLVGTLRGGYIIASYATGVVNGGPENNNSVGGLVGFHSDDNFSIIIASYTTSTVDGGGGDVDDDRVGKIIGAVSSSGSYANTYGFGHARNVDIAVIDGSTLPAGVSAPSDLTASNTAIAACIGINHAHAYTTKTTCEATSKTACTWASGACSGNVTGIDCSAFLTQDTCTATTGKTAGTWVTNVWNSTAAGTAGAWDFGTSSQIPALRYADYDGVGTTYNCNQFPSNVTCGTTLLPGQRD